MGKHTNDTPLHGERHGRPEPRCGHGPSEGDRPHRHGRPDERSVNWAHGRGQADGDPRGHRRRHRHHAQRAFERGFEAGFAAAKRLGDAA